MNLRDKKQTLQLRANVMAAVRAFFRERSYFEVETPIRVRTPAMEDHIDAEPSGSHWLRTSPELHMKRMVCAGYEKIFQIGPCFREGERGEKHLPEYTMLEWYCSGADYMDLVSQTQGLLAAVAEAAAGTEFGGVDLTAEPLIISVEEAFQKWAGWNPVTAFDTDRFDIDLVEKVEPELAKSKVPVIFKDFPAERAALARVNKENPLIAERWEMYVGGVEIANAYSELTHAEEQRQRFETCAESRRQRGQTVYPLDEAFLTDMEKGMPACAGIALGMDRLIMQISGMNSIAEVVAFSDG